MFIDIAPQYHLTYFLLYFVSDLSIRSLAEATIVYHGFEFYKNQLNSFFSIQNQVLIEEG